MRTILLQIDAGEKTCDGCMYLEHFSTGLVGEWHKRCEVFGTLGKWRENNMQRPKICLAAEKAAWRSVSKAKS